MNVVHQLETFETIPPHNIEAEQALLGAILLNNEAFHLAGDIAKDDFFEPVHQHIFDTAAKLIRADKKATPVTLKPFLPVDLDIVGLSLGEYLARLAAEAASIINAKDYAAQIKDHARRRAAILIAQDLMARAYHPEPDQAAGDLIAKAIGELDTIGNEKTRELAAVSINEALTRAVDNMAAAYQRDGQITGITWGLADLDAKTLGLHPGEMVILGGRPGMGKSAVAVDVALAASEARRGVGICSLEMSAESLALRAIAERVARIGFKSLSYHQMRGGHFDETDFNSICDAAKAMAKLPLIIDEQPLVTAAQLPNKIRRLRRLLNRAGAELELLIVDYLQLMTPGERYRGQRVQEVTEISSALKRLARQENIAVIALSQLSREVEKRSDKRPNLSDLRESGSIEQDADTVIFLYREAYYLEQSRPPESDIDAFGKWLADSEKAHGKLECIIAKQRHGPTGMVQVYFDPATNTVRDLDGTHSHHQA